MEQDSGRDNPALVNHAAARHGPSGFDPARDPTPEPFWLIMTKENYALRFSFDCGNYAIDFRLFGAAEGFHAGSDVGSWCLFNGNDSHEFDEWEQAFCEIDGSLKWDGCINWQTNPECMAHGCGPSYVKHLTAIFSAIYAAGGWFYDFLGDEPPAMPEGVIGIVNAQAIDARSGETEGLDPKGESAVRQDAPEDRSGAA